MKMQKYTITTRIIVALAMIIANCVLCDAVESAKIDIAHEFCKCTNATTEIKCICINNKMTRIPIDLPTPLHEL